MIVIGGWHIVYDRSYDEYVMIPFFFSSTSKRYRNILLLYPRLYAKTQYSTLSSYIFHVFIGIRCACLCVYGLFRYKYPKWWRIFIENGFACEMRINERNWKMTKDIIWHVYVGRFSMSPIDSETRRRLFLFRCCMTLALFKYLPWLYLSVYTRIR